MTSKCMTCFKSKNERKKMDLLPKDHIVIYVIYLYGHPSKEIDSKGYI